MSNFSFKEDLAKAYGLYAMSVIKGRALPRLEDGLKPVQRRILYSMFESGFRFNKPFKKSARIVGDVIGKYHPHGDAPAYEALVHLAQDFIMNMILVEGHGNFGSIDGDRAASSRYTQARLSQISEYLLQDYEKNTVLMTTNYDETLLVPDVLPAQFPNLLVNGSSGIAVGMATSIPPHNLTEVLDGTIHLLENEDASLEDIMKFIKGPDFPTYGEFFGGSELKKAYETGRGRVILKGTIVEENKGGKETLVITSIPYQGSKSKIIERIAELIQDGTIADISDIRDESGVDIRVAIELKKNANADLIKQCIFALTPLQTSFSLNMVAIYKDQAETFSLLKILQEFLKFREEIIIKRAEFILHKTLSKIHITWGLYLATNMLDKIISTIRAANNPKEAEEKLMEIPWEKNHYLPIIEIIGKEFIKTDPYYFSNEQVKGILDLRLHKLTKLEQNILINDLKELQAIINEQQKIIENREYRKNIMKEEFTKIKDKFGKPRKTLQLSMIDSFAEEDLIEREAIVLMISAHGYIKRVKLEEYKVQNRGGKGKISNKKAEDPIINLFMMDTLTSVLFFTSKGKVFEIKAYEIPESSLNSRGRAAVNLFKLEEGETITTILPLEKLEETNKHYLFFITKKGTVRKNTIEDFSNIRSNGKIAMKFEDEDQNKLHSVLLVEENDEILLTSAQGNAIRFNVSDIRIFESRASQGVRGMNISNDDYIVGAAKISPNDSAEILCVTKNGFGKRTSFEEYKKIKRGGKGSKAMNVNEKTGSLVSAIYVEKFDEILLMSQNSQTIRIDLQDIRKTGRVTSGVNLIKLPDKDYLTQVIRIKNVEENEDDSAS